MPTVLGVKGRAHTSQQTRQFSCGHSKNMKTNEEKKKKKKYNRLFKRKDQQYVKEENVPLSTQ